MLHRCVQISYTTVMSHIASILSRFGNVREAALKIGRPPSVIQYWRAQNRVPATAQAAVLAAADRHGVNITAADLIPLDESAALASGLRTSVDRNAA